MVGWFKEILLFLVNDCDETSLFIFLCFMIRKYVSPSQPYYVPYIFIWHLTPCQGNGWRGRTSVTGARVARAAPRRYSTAGRSGSSTSSTTPRSARGGCCPTCTGAATRRGSCVRSSRASSGKWTPSSLAITLRWTRRGSSLILITTRSVNILNQENIFRRKSYIKTIKMKNEGTSNSNRDYSLFDNVCKTF